MINKLILLFRRAGSFLSHSRLINLAKPETLFLALAIPFGILFIFLSAPFQAPDEHVHFYRAYAISTGHLSGTQVTLPESVLDFSQTVSKGLPGNDQNKQSKKALLWEFSRPFMEQPEAAVSIINSAIISPLPYLPQSFGVLIGRLAQLNPIFIFYLGRLTNFLAWLCFTLLAIRVTPIHPRLFVALALMPMTLHQAASNSPDATTIALSFLFVAYALRILFKPREAIPWADWVKIALLMAGVALCKSVYVLLAGLLVAVIFRRFYQQRAVLPMGLAVIGLGLACGLAWLQISSQFVSVETMNSLRTPTPAGVSYILRNPLIAAPLLWNSVVTNAGTEMRQFVGILGWMDTVLPSWVYPLYYGLLLFAILFEPHPSAFFLNGERIWAACMAVGASLLLMAIFFYPGAAVSENRLEIPQGRYFLPFGALYFLPFSQRRWAIANESAAWVIVGLLHGLVLIVTARAMLWRYYAI